MPCKECSALCQSSCITVHMAGASPCTVRFACLVLQASAVASSFGSPQDPLLQSSSPFLWPLWPHLWAWRSADGPSATDSTKAHAHRGLYDRRGHVKLPCCSSHALLGWGTAQSLKHRQEQTPVSTWYKPAPSSTSCLHLPTVGLHGKLQLSSQPFVGKRVRPSCHCACTCPTPSERGT